MRDPAHILEAEEITVQFGGVRAVASVSLAIRAEGITALIGPNGAGKTTFFNTITRLVQPTSGRLFFAAPAGELELTALPPDHIARAGIARTFQNIRLFTDLSVLDNVKVGLHGRTKGGFWQALAGNRREERRITGAALQYLDFVGLADRAAEQSESLSYGEQRKLEIARALACGPRLLLLDEPAAGMNPQETQALVELIRRIRQAGLTILLIEHDMKLVMRISDFVYVLDHGELIAAGHPTAVQKDPRVIAAYLGPQYLPAAGEPR